MEDKDYNPIRIRWMIKRDIPEVLEIEKQSFECPQDEDDFISCLKQRNCIGMVAEDFEDELVKGFMVYELCKDHLYLINLAVSPEYRREGVGTSMIDNMKRKLSLERRQNIKLEVRESNLEGQLFFSKKGFRAESISRDFNDIFRGDAYFFRYNVYWGMENLPEDERINESDFEKMMNVGVYEPRK